MAYKRTGKDLKKKHIWGRREMGMIAMTAVVAIQQRAFVRGHGFDDKPHKKYSTNPLYISKKGSTARRLKPKGGRPSRSGKSIFYARGYWQYKKDSTTGARGPGSGKPNLLLSGQLMRSIRATKISRTSATIKITGSAAGYGGLVDKARPFFGISQRDSLAIAALFHDVLKSAVAGRRGMLLVGASRHRV